MVPELCRFGEAFPNSNSSQGTKTGLRGSGAKLTHGSPWSRGSSGPDINMEIAEGNFCVKHRTVT